MKKKILSILFLTLLVVNFDTPTISESVELTPKITNIQPQYFGKQLM